MKIAACVPTYNEEKRIRYCLQCLKWCDDVYVLDKSSTDNTVKIAREMGAKVKIIPHERGYDPHEIDYLKNLDCDWVVGFTCSDLIDKSLAIKVKETLQTTDADVVYVPFQQYVLGINNKKSPWYAEKRRLAFRKSVIKVNPSSVHAALYFDSKKDLLIEGDGFMYHLTHETADSMMDRHIRYWRGEADCFAGNIREPGLLVIRGLLKSFFKGSLWSGWSIFMLFCAFLSYRMMSFVFIWEKKYSKAPLIYQQLREKIYSQWI